MKSKPCHWPMQLTQSGIGWACQNEMTGTRWTRSEADPAEASAAEPTERRRWQRRSRRQHVNRVTSGTSSAEFSTRELPAAEQLVAWQALMEPLVAISLPDGVGPADGFPADHTAWNLGGMLLVQQSVRAHGYIRSAAKIRSSSIDHWCLALLRSGRTWTEVDGRVAEGRPGSVDFRSLGQAFRGRTTGSESVCLYLPRDRLARVAATADARNNAILSGNFVDLLTDYVYGVVERLSSLTTEDLPRIVQAMSDIIAAGLAAGGDREVASAQISNLALVERARRYVQNHLNVADLAQTIFPALLASLAHASTSCLNQAAGLLLTFRSVG